ncbi:hypothetical protein BJH93_15305 [Kocuria polaris]|nr:hypothetical protein [Kocuria polaris]
MRWSLSRGVLICLTVGVIVWIGVSLVVRPFSGGGRELQTVELHETVEPHEEAHAQDSAAGAPSAAPAVPSTGPEGSGTTPERGASGVLVHVVGAVREPGVYELESGARALEALEAAGGATTEAATEIVNLAAEVSDGQQIWIPTRSEAEEMPAPIQSAGQPGGTGAEAAVNVNTADAAGLEVLPGIGPALAGRIVDFRERNGPFKDVGDLGAVSGIGPVLLEQLGDLVAF